MPATYQTTATYGKPQSPWNWKTKVPASDKYYWLASFGLSRETEEQRSNTVASSFTHHPCVTKARTTLHAHVRTLTQLATQGFWVNLHLVKTYWFGHWVGRLTIILEYRYSVPLLIHTLLLPNTKQLEAGCRTLVCLSHRVTSRQSW